MVTLKFKDELIGSVIRDFAGLEAHMSYLLHEDKQKLSAEGVNRFAQTSLIRWLYSYPLEITRLILSLNVRKGVEERGLDFKITFFPFLRSTTSGFFRRVEKVFCLLGNSTFVLSPAWDLLLMTVKRESWLSWMYKTWQRNLFCLCQSDQKMSAILLMRPQLEYHSHHFVMKRATISELMSLSPGARTLHKRSRCWPCVSFGLTHMKASWRK